MKVEPVKVVRKPCKTCARMRRLMPPALRKKLEEMDRRRRNPEAF